MESRTRNSIGKDSTSAATAAAGGAAAEQVGAPMRLRISDHDVKPSYTNAFRSNASADEVIIDFGIDLVVKRPQSDADAGLSIDDRAGEILFDVSHRMVMNYYTAKRLALILGQLINNHETQFGELKLNVSDRIRPKAA